MWPGRFFLGRILLDLQEFISMLSDEEPGRNDFSIIHAKERRDKKKAAVLKARAEKLKEDKLRPL